MAARSACSTSCDPSSNALMAWNSSSAIASRRFRSVASCAGIANTASASRATSLFGTRGRKRHREPRSRLQAELGPERPEQLRQPGPHAIRPCVGRQERTGIALEKGHVRAVAADRDADRHRAPLRYRAQRLLDERRFAVASRRDQEHFLAGQQVLGEPFQLDLAVHERRCRDHLAVNEGVLHGYVSLRNEYVY